MITFRIIRDAMAGADPVLGQLMAGDLCLQTLEDPWRNNQPNVSCIPLGTYPVTLSFSQHFGRLMPEIQNVPGREFIRIHGGNTTADTHGCVLVGFTRVGPDVIGDSQHALGYFYQWLCDALAQGPVSVEVVCADTL